MRRYVTALVLLVFALVLLDPLIFEGRIFYYRDFGRFYDPIKTVCLERMRSGQFPLWLPGLDCGTPVHGELVHGLLYPGNVFLLLSETTGWGLYFAFHVFLAGLGMALLAKRLGAGRSGALAAGIAFAGSGYLVAQLNHVPYATAAAWIPLVLHEGLRAGDRGRGAIPLLALCLTMAALAGEPFTILLGVTFLVVLILAGSTGSRVRALAGLAVAGGVALLLASPALLPAWQQLSESTRAGGAAPTDPLYGSVHPLRLFTLLSPEALGRQQYFFEPAIHFLGKTWMHDAPVLTNLHLGGLTLIAVCFAAFRVWRRRRRTTIALLAVFLGGLLLSLGTYLHLSTLLTRVVPGLDAFRYPDKYWFVVTLAAALLVGLFLERMDRRTAVFAFVLAGLSLAVGLDMSSSRVAIYGALPFALCGAALLIPARFGRPALVGILFFDLLLTGMRINISVPPSELRRDDGIAPLLLGLNPTRIFVDIRDDPEEIIRNPVQHVLTVRNALRADVGLPRGIWYSFGYDPLTPIARIDEYFGLGDEVAPEWRTFIRHRLLRLVDNTHSITNANLKGDGAVRWVIRGQSGINAYAYRDPCPRARLYGTSMVVPDVEAARSAIHDRHFDPYHVLVLEPGGVGIDNGPPEGSVTFEIDRPEHVRLRVHSDRLAWLFLADAWSRGWEATVNGRKLPIRHAMVAFRAVPVPEGDSVVDFRYRPSWLAVVPYSFAAGLLGLLALFWPLLVPFFRRRRRPDRKAATGGEPATPEGTS